MPPSLAQLPDEALLALVARADDEALAALYDRFGGVAYRLAFRVLRDQVLAQDAVQEAFLAAWRTAVSFDPARGKASTWLLTLVHRRAVEPGGYLDAHAQPPLVSIAEGSLEAPNRKYPSIRF